MFFCLSVESKVLGTFITEWNEGAAICKKLLSTEESAHKYAERLAVLAVALGFDGWLVYATQQSKSSAHTHIHHITYKDAKFLGQGKMKLRECLILFWRKNSS